ncbi:hypothetical protein SDC9_24958 [bioreactor metagenome]|uniref:ATPase AAA-type core domain-containing protein n=1 Tax=bioreactor metagenome TaxID=1076179 RepID=A0A644UJW9_9ZZZZ|nr:ATP-binding protein [Macellibacteroides fermentans]
MFLLEFTTGNFLSFREKKTLSMEAAKIKEYPENVIQTGKYNLLKSAVIYGANASGKSNLIKALKFMLDTIINSARLNSTDTLNAKPFLLDEESSQKPSYFELLFIDGNNRFRYGFEIDDKRIHSEWLYLLPLEAKSKKDNMLFVRQGNEIIISEDFNEGKGLESKTRDNGLFLSVCDQFNGLLSKQLMSLFGAKIKIMSGIDHNAESSMTSFFMKTFEDISNKFFQDMQLGFTDIELAEEEKRNEDKAITTHNKYNAKEEIIGKVNFKIRENESSGTNKIYDMAGYLLLGLNFGVPVIIDELDAKLHPLLTHKIIELFHSPETNPKNAQLIFSTHDTNLLGCNCFRRDQIWFTEKDRTESTDLYSLVEFKEPDGGKVRNDRSFEKDYIAGRYGAIPFIGNFNNLINHDHTTKN